MAIDDRELRLELLNLERMLAETGNKFEDLKMGLVNQKERDQEIRRQFLAISQKLTTYINYIASKLTKCEESLVSIHEKLDKLNDQ